MLSTAGAVLRDLATQVNYEAWRRLAYPSAYSSRILALLARQGFVVVTSQDVCLTPAGVKRAHSCASAEPAERAMRELRLTLRKWRKIAGLTQRQAAALSGVGTKSLSSFESGSPRIAKIKLAQVLALVRAYRLTDRQIIDGLKEILRAANAR